MDRLLPGKLAMVRRPLGGGRGLGGHEGTKAPPAAEAPPPDPIA